MKTSLIILAAGASVAAADVVAFDYSTYDIYTAQRDGISTRGIPSQYSDMQTGPDGYVAFPPTALDANGLLEVAGTADYTSVAVDNIVLEQFRFVGGVDQVGGVAFFDFFDAGGAFVDGFGVSFDDAGNFIWTIDLGTPFEIANAGFVQMLVDDEDLAGIGSNAAGQWFLGNNGADIGNAGAPEASPDFNYNFELNGQVVPAPAALAMLGLGGLAAARRRR